MSIETTYVDVTKYPVSHALRNVQPQPGFLEGVLTIADKTGTVFIIDEVSTVFRLNTGGAHLVIGNVTPDVAVFSKALGNGYPIAAIIGKADIMQAAQNTFISSTMWPERIGPTAALATIRKHKAVDAGKHLVHLGEQIQSGWKIMADKHGLAIEIGGMEPMSHFAFTHKKAQSMKTYFIQLMLEKGFLASTLFYAMYAHKTEHVEQYLNAVGETFATISDANQICDLEKRLKGKISNAGFKRLN